MENINKILIGLADELAYVNVRCDAAMGESGSLVRVILFEQVSHGIRGSMVIDLASGEAKVSLVDELEVDYSFDVSVKAANKSMNDFFDLIVQGFKSLNDRLYDRPLAAVRAKRA